MPTNVGTVRNVTLQKFVDAVISSIRRPDGSVPNAAPNAWKDRLQRQVAASDTTQFEVMLRINPDGNTAVAEVRAIGSNAAAIVGVVDTNLLATKLV